MTEMTDQEYVESIVKPLVDNPADVVTTRTLDERGVLIQLTVNQADMGKVIGREGRTAKAVRSLLRVFGARSDARINLKIVEPGGGEVAIGDDERRESRAEAPAYQDAQPIAETPSEPVQNEHAEPMAEPIAETPDEKPEESATGVI